MRPSKKRYHHGKLGIQAESSVCVVKKVVDAAHFIVPSTNAYKSRGNEQQHVPLVSMFSFAPSHKSPQIKVGQKLGASLALGFCVLLLAVS